MAILSLPCEADYLCDGQCGANQKPDRGAGELLRNSAEISDVAHQIPASGGNPSAQFEEA